MEAGKTHEVLKQLENLSKEINPKFPFTYRFADEEYGRLYTSETIIGNLSKYFSALAILLSCMGLLGLMIFTAEQRTKEIGIRKVLGANAASVFQLLSKDIVLLILLAFAIATPFSWWVSDRWLQSFEYRVDLKWWIFAEAGLITAVIAGISVGSQVIRSALANPVTCLRSE